MTTFYSSNGVPKFWLRMAWTTNQDSDVLPRFKLYDNYIYYENIHTNYIKRYNFGYIAKMTLYLSIM